jgi:serine/threonine protein kinase
MALEALQSGRYHHLRLLGSGGMGEVYLMQDERVNRQVAIKVIRSENASSLDSDAAANAARLFQREAKAIATLEHPNILPLYDFGEEISEGTTISYMVMPFCAEGSLAGWLGQRAAHPLSPQDIAALIEQAAEALQYAHDHDVIHLDVKPPNFLLRGNRKNPNRPTLLLADFGIARSSTTVSSSSRTIRGTPTSMAPEQWSSNPVSATDQYALAVMAYELLTGRAPFVGSMEQLMYQHFSAQPPAPRTFNPRLPTAINPVLLRALAKKPEDRFPSIAAFASALQDAVQILPAETGREQQGGIDMYTTLAISKEEANTGISHMVTLPGGRQVNISIPAGTRDGQVIRLPDPTKSSSQPGDLVLNITVKSSDEARHSNNAISAGSLSPITPQSFGPVSGHDLPTMAAAPYPIQATGQQPPVQKKTATFRLGLVSIVSVLVILLIVVSGLFYFSAFQSSNRQLSANALNSSSTAVAQTKTASHILTSTPTPGVTPTSQNGLYIPDTYNGSMFNQTTGQTTTMTVFVVQTKGNGSLSGSVTFNSPTQEVYPLTGTVDLQGTFFFSIQQPAGQQPLLYYGAVQQKSDGNYLQGNFCNSTTNSCISNLGYFDVGPGY